MSFLIGGLISSLELVTIGVLLKIGSHLGTRWLTHCGEEPLSSAPRVRGGRKRALEQVTGRELSIFP